MTIGSAAFMYCVEKVSKLRLGAFLRDQVLQGCNSWTPNLMFFDIWTGAESQKQPTPEVSWSDNFKMAGSMTLPARPKQTPSGSQAKGELKKKLKRADIDSVTLHDAMWKHVNSLVNLTAGKDNAENHSQDRDFDPDHESSKNILII